MSNYSTIIKVDDFGSIPVTMLSTSQELSAIVANTVNTQSNITNSFLNVSAFVANASVPVTVGNASLNVDANVTNSFLNASAYITNAVLPVNITNSYLTVSADIINPELTVSVAELSGQKGSNSNPVVVNFAPNTVEDAFGRVRVSEPFTIFDSKQLNGDNPFFWSTAASGTGTSAVTYGDACIQMTVDGANSFVIRQTKMRFNYQPAKSQLAFLTFSHFETAQNVTKRVGLFNSVSSVPYDTLEGLYIQSDSLSGITLNVAKNTGTISNQSVAQIDWNMDKMNGSGKSGIELDFSKNQIMVIDYEWLGVGRVRMGFVVGGGVYYCHEFKHSGNTSYDHVYMSSPNLSVRYEIRTGDSSGTGRLDHICAAVISEGGYDPNGIIRTISRGTSPLGTFSTANVADGTAPMLLSMRLKPTYLNSKVILQDLEIISSGTMAGTYEIFVTLNPTITVDSGTWVSLDNSAVEYIADSAITSRITPNTGLVIHRSYFTAPANADRKEIAVIRSAVDLGCSVDGVRDRLVVGIQKVATGNDNASIFAAMQFRDIS